MSVYEKLVAAMKAGKFTFCMESKKIPGKWVFFFDYEDGGDICGHGERGAAVYEYANGLKMVNQYGPLVYEQFRTRFLDGDF